MAIPECFRDLGWSPRSRLHRRWTIVDEMKIHGWSSTEADGTPFVLIHGLVISSLYMLPLAELLSTTHAVHAIDLPGFGRSASSPRPLDVPELARFVSRWLAAIDVGRCHLVANSLGCQIAAHLSANLPDTVETVTLIGATIDPAAYHLPTQIIRLMRDAMQEPPRLWVNWIFDFMRAGMGRALGTTRAMFRDRIEEQLPRIRARTLVLRGEKDPTMPAAWAQQATRLLGDGRLVAIAGHGHCVHYTNPALVARAIIAHAEGNGSVAPLSN